MPQERHSGPKRHNIRDIAELAGVSRSTVSLAINDSPKINEQTKKRVLAIIAEVGYRPNATARNLVMQSTRTLCVVLPRLDRVVADTYFSESLSGILDTATQHGYHMLVEMATPEFKAENRILQMYRQRTMDGVLAVGSLTTDSYLMELVEAGCPAVLVNSELPGVPCVLADNESAACAAVKHLYDLGHRRIAHIRGSEFVTTALQRTQGYLRGLKEVGLEFREDYFAQAYFDQRSGYAATKWLLGAKERPTAIFTTNDMMALGAIDAIQDSGLTVPGDVAVFGGDDIMVAAFVSPALSTIRHPMYAIGQAATQKLLGQLTDDDIPETALTPLELVIRESCGAKK